MTTQHILKSRNLRMCMQALSILLVLRLRFYSIFFQGFQCAKPQHAAHIQFKFQKLTNEGLGDFNDHVFNIFGKWRLFFLPYLHVAYLNRI